MTAREPIHRKTAFRLSLLCVASAISTMTAFQAGASQPSQTGLERAAEVVPCGLFGDANDAMATDHTESQYDYDTDTLVVGATGRVVVIDRRDPACAGNPAAMEVLSQERAQFRGAMSEQCGEMEAALEDSSALPADRAARFNPDGARQFVAEFC